MLQEEKDLERYRSARNGDHLTKVSFECDLYHFRNINKQETVFRCKKDEDTLIVIWRAQLDIFWAREPSIVTVNFSQLREDYLIPP